MNDNDEKLPGGNDRILIGAGANPNISVQQQAINHGTSAAMTSVLECLTLQQSCSHSGRGERFGFYYRSNRASIYQSRI